MDYKILSGSFISNAAARTITFDSGIDWMRVYNYTNAGRAIINEGVEFFWAKGMPQGSGCAYYHTAAASTLGSQFLDANTGFFYMDPTTPSLSSAIALNGGFASNATQVVCETADTTGLDVGSVVRLEGTATALSISGWDFEVGAVVANTSFTMRYAMANAPGAAATAGSYRIVYHDSPFYPKRRYIVNITAANPAVITTSVSHGYKVGQRIKINIPDARFGMRQMNGREATITAVTDGTITTNINAVGFQAFTFALPGSVPFTMPTVVPIGMDMGAALAAGEDILSSTKYDTRQYAMRLSAGALSPAGAAGNVIYWMAGQSIV